MPTVIERADRIRLSRGTLDNDHLVRLELADGTREHITAFLPVNDAEHLASELFELAADIRHDANRKPFEITLVKDHHAANG